MSVSLVPGTTFEWIDQSDITTPTITSVNTAPIYATVFTSDKGKEGWQLLSGQDWFDMYTINNIPDFSVHGQPLLQAAMSINAGAQILANRICADDAYLANLTVVATVTTAEDGSVTVAYNYTSASGCTTKNEVIEAVLASVAESQATYDGDSADVTVYPMWTVFDNGRGDSRKRVTISPNYTLSKTLEDYFYYDLTVTESSSTLASIHFALNPSQIASDANISFQYSVNTGTDQVYAYQYDSYLTAYIDAMTAATGLDATDAASMDLVFGCNKKAVALDGITVDTEGGVSLNVSGGQLLLNGDNGSFGTNPLAAETYGSLLAKGLAGLVFDEEGASSVLTYSEAPFDMVIYDRDRFKIDAIIDANYPAEVKRAAETLVTFREDCMFFRDIGTSCNTLALISEANEANLKNKFCSTYCTYYDVIDTYSKKQITVTAMYDMAQLMVDRFNNGRHVPMAGIKFGFVLNNAIEGTVGYTPSIGIDINEKEDLVDMRMNYAAYIDTKLVVESVYTSQEKYSQFSFSNNILLVQLVIKTIRSKCPALRYTFIDGEDLEKYKSQIEEIIEPYNTMFDSLTIEYVNDPLYVANKIFYAALAVKFRNFVQTEYFTITALATE